MAERAEAKARKPVLLVAAESIAIASGMAETVADVVRERAMRHYGEGLLQYLTVRLRSSALAGRAMAEVKGRLEAASSVDLAMPPGARAYLYRLARGAADQLCPEASATAGELAWFQPAEHAPRSYVTGLAKLRRDLSRADQELLELRYARELTPEELAFVVELSVEDVITALERAAAQAMAILGRSPPSRLGGLRGAFQEAFSLLPQSAGSGPLARLRPAFMPGTVIGERYAIQERVGEGSFGDVYRALDMDVPGHVVALKILHRAAPTDEARKAALRELRLIASVFHPSVVDFKDHGWYRDRLWFVMPWYEGETLEERLSRERLTRAEAKEIFVPLAQALATMHAAGIRHQDIKPDNIFLARIDGNAGERILPVLIDLGVAAKEAEMIVAGTPLYFPPEIAAQYAEHEQRPPITPRADVFSLALSLRNALEPETQEQVPGTAVEAFIAFRADQPPPPPAGKDLAFLLPYFQRWLAKDAAQRPTAEELARELEVLTKPEEERSRRAATLRWATPLTIGAVVAFSSITYVYLRERDAATAARLRADETQHRLGAVSEQLKETHESSELTKQELSLKLLERDQAVADLTRKLGAAQRDAEQATLRMLGLAGEVDEAQHQLTQAQRRLDLQDAKVASLNGELFSAGQRAEIVESELRDAKARLTSSERELDGFRGRTRALLAELDRARGEASARKDRIEELERSVGAAEEERARAEHELLNERKHTRELSRELEAISSSLRPSAGGDTTALPLP